MVFLSKLLALRKSDVAILEGADESVLQEAQGDGGGQPTLGNLTVSGKENVAKTPMLATPPVIPPNKLAGMFTTCMKILYLEKFL